MSIFHVHFVVVFFFTHSLHNTVYTIVCVTLYNYYYDRNFMMLCTNYGERTISIFGRASLIDTEGQAEIERWSVTSETYQVVPWSSLSLPFIFDFSTYIVGEEPIIRYLVEGSGTSWSNTQQYETKVFALKEVLLHRKHEKDAHTYIYVNTHTRAHAHTHTSCSFLQRPQQSQPTIPLFRLPPRRIPQP